MPDHVSHPPDRIRAIKQSGLLSRPGSQQFDLLTEHVRISLGVPVAIISIVDEDRQVFAGHCGLPEPWASRGETPLTHSFCQYVVEKAEPLVVTDANVHELVSRNHAIADLGVVAYLGVPIALPTGEIVGALAGIDTQERIWTERNLQILESLAKIVEREIALGLSELKYRTLYEDMQEGYYIAGAIRDSQGNLVDIRFEEINPAFERLTGLKHDVVVGTRLSDLVPTAMADMIPAYDHVLRTGESLLHDNKERALGRWFENRLRKLDGDRLASLLTDVTDRKGAEEQQDFLNKEMSHRLKNTLAMVQAIASQTLRGVENRQFVEAFESRLHTLGSAHEILYKKAWQSASLDAVIASSLDMIGMSDRVDADGPSLEIGPRAVMATSLLIHELATNALKYGALSNDAGRVTINWRVEGEKSEEVLTLVWREQDGPPVREPDSKGFGSKLIRMGLIGTGGVQVRYEQSGFEAVMTAPLVQLQAE